MRRGCRYVCMDVSWEIQTAFCAGPSQRLPLAATPGPRLLLRTQRRAACPGRAGEERAAGAPWDAGLGKAGVEGWRERLQPRFKTLKIKDSRAMGKILCSLVLGLYLILFAILNLYLLDQHPLVNVDEPWYSDAAFNFTRTGHFTPTMFRGMHFNLEGKYHWWF